MLQTSPRKGRRGEEGQEGAKLRALEKDKHDLLPANNGDKKKLCRYFAKDDAGCRRGAKCPFEHVWDTTPKKGRCLLCSAVGHLQKDCPTKEGARNVSRSPDEEVARGKERARRR